MIWIYAIQKTCDGTLWTQRGVKSQKIEYLSQLFLYRPNAKMAAKLIFFCLCVNQSNWPRSEGRFLLYFVRANEANQAN